MRVWASTERLILCILPAALLGAVWMIGTLTVDHLLYHDAVTTGQGWAGYLADNVKDLDRIAAGAKPSADSQGFFDRVQRVGQIFRYVIYDVDGHPRLHFDAHDIDATAQDKDDARNPSALQVIATSAPLVHAKDGASPSRPAFFADTYVPLIQRGKVIGVVETYVDQTGKRDAYRQTLVETGASLLVLIGLAFGLPALAWIRRSREKRLADAHLNFLAHHDALTGLTNRNRLSSLVTARLTARPKSKLALHYIDIDNFKDINDTLGHDIGDALIVAVAARLAALVANKDHVARAGGDEFVLLQADITDASAATALAGTIVRTLARPFDINGHAVAVTASVGVAVAPEHGQDVTRLMKSADLALYQSKAGGRNAMSLFCVELDQDLKERLGLERALRHAVDHDGFELYFQPAVEMPARRLVGFEALIRMRDEQGAIVFPGAFIPLAERMGLIERIGTWVLREACRAAAHWPSNLKVAVNLSPAQLTAGHLADKVAAILAETALEPRRLELEITEGILLDNSDEVLAELHRLKALGIGIVMDDFGTGYSSLSYLWKFPFDKIKIDRAFMLALDDETRQDASTIVRTIIDLGRSLNVTVTVEGVENDRQVDFVNAAHCDQIQGYYFGGPIPITEVAAHILKAMHPCDPARLADLRRTVDAEVA